MHWAMAGSVGVEQVRPSRRAGRREALDRKGAP